MVNGNFIEIFQIQTYLLQLSNLKNLHNKGPRSFGALAILGIQRKQFLLVIFLIKI